MKKKLFSAFSAILLLLSLATLLRIINIGKEFSGDEGILLEISEMDFDRVLPAIKTREVYPPLSYLLLHQWMRAGSSHAWIRLYFVLFGAGSCLLIYLIAREYLNLRFARISLILASFSPLLIFSSQYARSYTDSAFWMLLSTLFMLRIINGKERVPDWTGYVFSAILALYTFYISFLLIFAQALLVVIFRWRDKRLVFRWLLALLLVVLLFVPWLPAALGQFRNLSSIVYDASSKAFTAGGVHLGLFTRNILALAGFDPDFMVFRGGVKAHFSKGALLGAVVSAFSVAMVFMYVCVKNLKDRFRGDNLKIWFLPTLVLVPLCGLWFFSMTLNLLPNAKYFVAFHGLSLMLISFFIYVLWEKRRGLGILSMVFILGVYGARIPSAVAPEYEMRKAHRFLKENVKSGEGVVCIRSCPREDGFDIIRLESYFKLNERGTEFVFASSDTEEGLKQEIAPFKRLWFYRAAGTVETFGANDLLGDWLEKEGYKKGKTESFKNIEVVRYEKE